MRNSISISALSEYTNEVKQDPAEGIADYGVELQWQSGTRTRVSAQPMHLAQQRLNRDFNWVIDEPRQLLGTNQAPNPQEYLLSGLGACISVAFTVGASVMEISIESLKVSVKGTLNLAGFLGVDSSVPVGFKTIEYHIEVAGDGTPEQFEALREKALASSPNAMTLAKGTDLQGSLSVL